MIDLAPLAVSDAATRMYESFDFFVFVVTLGMGAIGAMSRSMAVGAFAGFITFAYIASTVDNTLYTNILYITLTLVFIGFAFKLIRLEATD